MKKVLIIYNEIDLQKNRKFVEMCRQVLEPKGFSCQLVIDGRTPIDYSASFAINRSRNAELARALEGAGVRVYNNSRVTEICNDKWKTYKWAKENNLPVLPTYLETVATDIIFEPDENEQSVSDPNAKQLKSQRPESFPQVVKSRDGHGGSEVFLVQNQEEFQRSVNTIKNRGGSFISQPLADTGGRDIRVYVLGGHIVTSMCRQAQDGFKSNYSLGGSAAVYQLSRKERQLVTRVMDLLKPDYAGIDFIYDGDKLVLNEIEDAVGARMVYENTDIDIVGEFARYCH